MATTQYENDREGNGPFHREMSEVHTVLSEHYYEFIHARFKVGLNKVGGNFSDGYRECGKNII